MFHRLLKADQILCEAAERLRALGLTESASAVELCRAPIAEQLNPLQDRVYAEFAARVIGTGKTRRSA